MFFSFLSNFKESYRSFVHNNQLLSKLYKWSVIVITIFMAIYMYYEKISLMDMIYFTIVTISTVGFGDISPTLWQTKILTMGFILSTWILIPALFSIIATKIVDLWDRKNKGRAKVKADIDFVIAGGYPDKIEDVCLKLLHNNPKLNLCILTDAYEERPDFCLTNGIHFIKGSITSEEEIIKVNKGKFNKVILLEKDPINKTKDAFIKLAFMVIKSINPHADILATVVRDNLVGFPKDNSIRYMQVSRSAIVAKEALTPGVYRFFYEIFNNLTHGNQYNYTLQEKMSWYKVYDLLIAKNAIPAGYLTPESTSWSFFNRDDISLTKGTVIKYFSGSNHFLSEEIENKKLLIIGYDSYKGEKIIDQYLADERYIESKITIITNKEFTINSSAVTIIKGDATDEQLLCSKKLSVESFDDILILSDIKNPSSDDEALLAYSIIRELHSRSKIIVEIIDEDKRVLLEKNLEDSVNQFTGISHAGQLVQEIHDPGAIDIIECFADDMKPENIFETILDKECSWSEYTQRESNSCITEFPVGYKIQNKDWSFVPSHDETLPIGTTIKYLGKK